MKPKMCPAVSNARLSGRKHGRAAREDDGDGEDALTVALARRAAKYGPMAAPPSVLSRPPIRQNHPMHGREDVSSEEEEEEEEDMGRSSSSDSDGDEESTLGHSRERSLQDQVRAGSAEKWGSIDSRP